MLPSTIIVAYWKKLFGTPVSRIMRASLVFKAVFPYCWSPRRLTLKTLKSVIRTLRKQKRIAAQTIEKLTQEVERIDAGIAALNTGTGGRPPGKTRRSRRLSKAARQRISIAQKKRWAAARKAAS
jgi:cell division protein FtsB